MKKDPIIQNIHKTREIYAKRFGNDLHAICDDARAKQGRGGHRVVKATPKPVSSRHTGDAVA